MSSYIVESPWPKIEIPHVSVQHFILQKLRFHGNKTFLIENETGNSFTFTQLANDSLRFATALNIKGFNDGDHLGICGYNNYEFIVTLIGGIIAGGVIIPINGNSTKDHIITMMHKRKIKFMTIVNRNKTSCVNEMIEKYKKGLKTIIAFSDEDNDATIKSEEFSSLRNNLSSHKLENKYHDELFPFDYKTKNCLILESSGVSNSETNGCIITHYNFISMLTISTLPFTGYNWTDHDIVANTTPFSHANGISQLFVALTVGAQLVLFNQYDAKIFLSAVEKWKITSAMLTPYSINEIFKSDEISNYNLHSLKKIISTSSPLAKYIGPQLVEKFGIEDFRQGYGMTETIGFIAMESKGSDDYGCSGVPMPLCQIKIIDADTGEILNREQIGEIYVKSPMLFTGYFENDEKNSETIKELWFHSGDIGYFDKNGKLQVIDPICDFIKHKSVYISPTALETVLLSHDGVKDAAIVGVQNKCDEQILTAFVVIRDAQFSSEELTNYLNVHLIKQNLSLNGGLYFIDEIPKCECGKNLRRKLREIMKQFIYDIENEENTNKYFTIL